MQIAYLFSGRIVLGFRRSGYQDGSLHSGYRLFSVLAADV